MIPHRQPDLPLHKIRETDRYSVANVGLKLNNALEKGLDMAGLKKTKTGAGEKEKAYVVKTYTMLVFLMITVILLFAAGVFLITQTMGLVLIKRESIHKLSVNRAISHAAQAKLMSVHMQLQKALDSEVHETLRLEEYRSMIEKIFGQSNSKIQTLLEDAKVMPEERKTEINNELKKTEAETLKALNILIGQFQKKSEHAKKKLTQMSKEILDDIKVDEKEQKLFKESLKDLGGTSNFDYKAELSEKELTEFGLHNSVENEADFGEIDDEDAEVVKKDLESFYKHLNELDFPSVDPEQVDSWEKRLTQTIDTLEDEEKETDLSGFEQYVKGELISFGSNIKLFNPEKDRSIIDYFENIIYEAKLMPHKQELLDMYAGWKTGSLTPFQVLANIQEVAETERLFLIYEWLNGFKEELSETYLT